jgi:hypothetical protein
MIVGIPLEMSHPTSRVAAVYFLGVIGGALGSSVITSDKRPLTGASGNGGERGREREREGERGRDTKQLTLKVLIDRYAKKTIKRKCKANRK